MGYMINLNTGKHGYTSIYLDEVENTVFSFAEPKKYFWYDTEGGCYDIMGYGFCGVAQGSSFAMSCMQLILVQMMLGDDCKKIGSLCCECFCIPAEEFKHMNVDVNMLRDIAGECASYYYRAGYQVFFVIHMNSAGKVLLHFLVNPVSYLDQKPWRRYTNQVKDREVYFNQIIERYMCRDTVYPILLNPVELIQEVD